MATGLPSDVLEHQAVTESSPFEEWDQNHFSIPSLPAIPLASSPPLPLSEREVYVKNDRDGGHKYHQAAEALRYAVERYEQELGDGFDCFTMCDEQIRACKINGKASGETRDAERFFVNLKKAVEAIKYPGRETDVRESYELPVKYLREAISSKFYQAHKHQGEPNCLFLQKLCLARFTEVHPYESFKGLVNNAISSSKTPETLQLLDTINLTNVGSTIRAMNHSLESAGSELRKSFLALCLQKGTGEKDVFNDPGGTMNVPYLRSRFTLVNEMGVPNEVGFCRFGAPTIRVWDHRFVDPTLLCFLDGLQNDNNKQFLYVNHLKPIEIEGQRAQVIRGIEITHPNFHFLSFPMDGAITDKIHSDFDMELLKEMIASSYKNSSNGCQWPARLPFNQDEFYALLEHVHAAWFFGRDMSGSNQQSINNREAFWGIFNTVLKHYVVQKLNIQFMNSACKDNKDRGGTLSTIDEVIRNLLLGRHVVANFLIQIVYSALAPYMIKLEHILDDPTNANHNRLGYLINVLDHISTLTPHEISFIQQTHAVLTNAYGLEQEIPLGPRPVERASISSTSSPAESEMSRTSLSHSVSSEEDAPASASIELQTLNASATD